MASETIKAATDEDIRFHFKSPGGAFCQTDCEDNPDCCGWGCELVSSLVNRIDADRQLIEQLRAALEKFAYLDWAMGYGIDSTRVASVKQIARDALQKAHAAGK